MYKCIKEHPSYSISENGEVYSSKTNKVLSGYVNENGYLIVNLDGIPRLVHRLVAATYLGLDLLSEMTVDHKDTNKLNNNKDNLQLLSRSDHAKKTNIDRGLRKYSFTKEQVELAVLKNGWAGAARELGASDHHALQVYYKSITSIDPKTVKTKHNKYTVEDIVEAFIQSNYNWAETSKILGMSYRQAARAKYESLTGEKASELKARLISSH